VNDVGDCLSMRGRQVTALSSGTPPTAMMIGSDALPYFADQDAAAARRSDGA
jgi:hypothetical protein